MAEEDKTTEGLKTSEKGETKGKSKLLSPDPLRRKFVAEMLHGFASRKFSFADLTRLDRRKLKQVAEMGFVKLRHGRYAEARQIFEVLTFLDHKNYFNHLALAGAFQKMRKYADAIFQYSEVLKYDPININALVNRGEIYLRNRNYRKAAEDFREAILADQNGKNRFTNRARSLVVAIKRLLDRDKAMKGRTPVKRLDQKRKGPPLRLVRSVRK